jgi:hypothetical protein
MNPAKWAEMITFPCNSNHNSNSSSSEMLARPPLSIWERIPNLQCLCRAVVSNAFIGSSPLHAQLFRPRPGVVGVREEFAVPRGMVPPTSLAALVKIPSLPISESYRLPTFSTTSINASAQPLNLAIAITSISIDLELPGRLSKQPLPWICHTPRQPASWKNSTDLTHSRTFLLLTVSNSTIHV